MLLRRLAAMSAVLVTSAGLAPAITHADTPSASTLYVNNEVGTTCSDGGPGTQAEPFCNIQAAVNVVNPGQTVSIAPGTYEPASITRSGTATAPINIVGYWPATPRVAQDPFTWIGRGGTATWTGMALTINGASYVNVSHVGIYPGSQGGLLVTGSSNVTVDRTVLQGDNANTGAPMVDITGMSSAVTFKRSFIRSAPITDIRVEGEATGTVISADDAWTDSPVPVVAVIDAPNTDIVGDTLAPDCATSVDVGLQSLHSFIENNIIVQPTQSSCPTAPALITADAAAAPTATVDYNDVMNNGPDYDWGGVPYTTPADFSAATGQGVHDLTEAKGIDSANSAAPGESSTDIYGSPRVDDPQVANTGAGPSTYYDRGAIELQEPLGISVFYASTPQAPTGGTVTFTATASSTWTSNLTYAFDFGDGSGETNTTGTATHVYTTTGSFTTSVAVTGSDGVPVSRTYPITIVPPAPLVASVALSPVDTMTVVATQQSTDAWAITSYTVDFGDGTTLQAAEDAPTIAHNYTKLGTYTVTLTTTDIVGQTASTSQKFTTAGSEYTAYGPVRVLDTRHGTGTGGVIAKLGANQTLKLKIAGNGAIPPNASAVAFNLTVTGPSAGGYLVAYPDGQTKPTTSNLNFTPGQTKATDVIVGVGRDGDVDLYNGSAGTVDLVADVSGYFTQAEATRYTPQHPIRILDTRHAIGTGGVIAKLGAGKTLTLWISYGQDSPLPGVNVAAVALNLTAVDETAGGYVTAYQDGTTRPVTSSLNFEAGQVVPNTVIVPVGPGGKIDLYNGSGGSIDLVADLAGYFGPGGTDAYLPVSPQRLYDSRTYGGPFTNCCNTGVDLQPLGEQPIIPFDLSDIAYVLNVTVTQTAGSGYVTVYPDDVSKPVVSNVNFTAGQTTANTAIAMGSAGGASDEFAVTFTLPSSSTQMIVDLFGYFSAT